jgi:zinc transport system substrate-binding protein
MLFITSSVVLSASCTQETEETHKLGVAVTILPQAEFVENIGGDKVNVTVMVPPGASPHTYEPTPSQMADLSEAALYAKVGSGVEFELAWMDKLISQNKDMLVVDCSKGIQLQTMVGAEEHEHKEDMYEDHEHEHEEDMYEEHEHEHRAMDPHIWMSPQNARIMVQNIADGLIQVDPDNRAFFKQNRDAYLQKLEQLDLDIRESLSEVKNRVFMVYHPAFGYFASAFNLTMLPVEADGKEPTPAGLQHLIEQATQHNIHVVFAEPQFNPQSAEVIADAINGRVVLIDPLAKDYINNISTLIGELVQAME